MSKLDDIQDESGQPLMFRDKTKQEIKNLLLDMLTECFEDSKTVSEYFRNLRGKIAKL